ncbi:hypothetical protein ACJBU6_06958 [Exserohilum turcicum]
MLPVALRALRSRSTAAGRPLARSVSTATTSNQVPANDAVSRDAKPNVSKTNEMATSSVGAFDQSLQESVVDAEQLRTTQAPNFKGIWSRSQNPRAVAMSGPRFEQTIIADQVCHFFPLVGQESRGRSIEDLEGGGGGSAMTWRAKQAIGYERAVFCTF